MSDIVADNQVLGNHCAKYIALCTKLETELIAVEKLESIDSMIEGQHLRIRFVLCELQILKIQVRLNYRITEKNILVLRNKFSKIIGIYQKIFIPRIPCALNDVVKNIELLNPNLEAGWLRDIRMLGLSLRSFANQARRSNSYPVILNYLYQFTALFRNSILYKNLRPQLGKINALSTLRREQIEIFQYFAADQIDLQRTFFVRAQSAANLENAIRISESMVELGFVTNNEFFDTEYYKKQVNAFYKILEDFRNNIRK